MSGARTAEARRDGLPEGYTVVDGSEAPAPDPGTWEHELATALADVRAKLATASQGKREPLFGMDAVELLARHFDGARWLVTGLITIGATGIIGGEPKTTKTWLATEITLGVATGTKVCGEFFAMAGSAAYFYAEDRDVQVRNRVRALLEGAGRKLAPGRLFLRPRGAFLDVVRDEDLAWIVASARKIPGLALLVLDPLRDIHSGEEDKSDSMRDVMRRVRLLGELLGCTVLVVHHAGKASESNSKRRPGQRLRGSGAIHGSIDAGIYLADTDGNGSDSFNNAVAVEVKGARSIGGFQLELAVRDNEEGEAVEAVWTVTKEEAKPAKTAKAAREAGDDEIAFKFVRDLAMRGENHSRRALRDHDERPGAIGEHRLRDAVDRLLGVGRLRLVGAKVHLPEVRSEVES